MPCISPVRRDACWGGGRHRQTVRLQPECARRHRWVDTDLCPPRRFIAAAVNLAMMAATQGHCELIADLAAHGPALGKAQMMGVTRYPAADDARLLGNKPDMLAVADAPWLGER